MTITATSQTVSLGADVVYDTGVVLVPALNVTGGAGTWYTIVAKSTDAATSYLKLFDATAVTQGTTQPNWILQCKPNDTTVWTVPDGVTFSTGLSYFASEENGAEAATAPSALTIWIVVKRS